MKNETVSSNYLNRKRKKCWVFEAMTVGTGRSIKATRQRAGTGPKVHGVDIYT